MQFSVDICYYDIFLSYVATELKFSIARSIIISATGSAACEQAV